MFITLGPRAGLARGYVEYQRSRFQARPVAAALERGGDTWAAGLEHYFDIPLNEGAWGAIGLRASRLRTHVKGNTNGFKFPQLSGPPVHPQAR